MGVHDAESALMILRNEKALFPLSTFAFGVAQSSQRELEQNIGAWVLFRDGRVQEIHEIHKRGLYGNTLLEKAKSALFGAYNIETRLQDVHIAFPELAALVADFLLLDAKNEDATFELDNPELIAEKIRSAANADELFQLISMPAPQDCLDVF